MARGDIAIIIVVSSFADCDVLSVAECSGVHIKYVQLHEVLVCNYCINLQFRVRGEIAVY